MDSLQQAFIHPPEPCDARIMDAHTLFKASWTVEQKHPPTAIIELGSGQDNFYYNSDWIRLKEEVIYT